jgi:hypothetical protein
VSANTIKAIPPKQVMAQASVILAFVFSLINIPSKIKRPDNVEIKPIVSNVDDVSVILVQF